MATYQFSALADGQAIAFNPNADALNFDQSVIAAADIRVATEGAHTRITVVEGPHAGKDVLLLDTSMLQFNTVNIRFANGSVLLIGDNSTSTAGDNGANIRTGTGGRDQLNGLGGADTLNGGGGDDVYFVSNGDVVSDSSGVDTVYSDVSWTFAIGNRLEHLTYIGTAAGATLTGNELNNIITGNDLAQASINGRAGNDTMFGLGGNDTFDMSTGGTASYGNDVIDGGAEVDTIDFGANARSPLNVNLASGSISGGGDAGVGSVVVSNVENVVGGAFADRMTGNAGANFFFGSDGADTLDGAAGADRLEGGAGADEYVFSVAPSGANADTIVGFATGVDRIVLDGTVHANLGANGRFAAGDERFHTGPWAAEADDRVIYNASNGQLWYDADGLNGAPAQLIATLQGAPTLAATDINVINGGSPGGTTITGTSGNDTLIGGDGDDRLEGREGNDSLNGSAGADTMDGGLGNDTFTVDDSGDVLSDAGGTDTVITIDLNWTLGDGFENLSTVSGSENPTNSSLADFLAGNALDNVIDGGNSRMGRLEGRGGNDTLFGSSRGYPTTLDGGAGDDVLFSSFGGQLTGGAGADRFSLSGFGVVHEITDFASAVDKIHLDATSMPALGTTGNFIANDERFHTGAAAAEGDDRVVYNPATRGLFYDADGSGSGEAILVATLQPGATLTATDIAVDNGTPPGQAINGTDGNDTLNGTPGDDTINGLGGNDSINGAEGADSLVGGAGNDSLQAGHGSAQNDDAIDTLDGGFGDDLYFVSGDGSGANDVILADPGGRDTVVARTSWTLSAGLENLDLNDFFGTSIDGTGNELDNVIRGGSEGGMLRGMGGNDTLIARQTQNSTHLFGGDGNDTLQGFGFGDLFGEAGNDVLLATGAASNLSGGSGADQFVFAGTGLQYTIADFASGSDKVHLDAANLTALGTTGNFTVGDERFHAGAAAAEADDRVVWNAVTRELWYDADGSGSVEARLITMLQPGATLVATDIVVDNGAPLGQAIDGTAGNDTLTGTSGDDTINGLGGNDSLDGAPGADSLVGGAGNDTLHSGRDRSAGDAASDTLDGGSGDDVYLVYDDGDVIVADPGGIDTVLARGPWTLGAGLENLEFRDDIGAAWEGIGNELDNRILSASEGGTLRGMGGNDTLVLLNAFNGSSAHGGDGNDTLRGGRSSELFGDAGNDLLIVLDPAGITTMTGGAGADHFSFERGFTNTITDFASGIDKIRLDAQVMTALGTTGNFTASDERFHAGAAAAEADDRVIWNATTRELWYDADGSGSGQALLIATLQAGASVVATDIIVDNGSLPPSGGQTITGTAGNDSLTGTNGNDTLDGLGGNDTLNGLLGDDTYIAQAGDVIQDSGGVDTLQTPSAWNLTGSTIENVTLTGTAAVGIQANNAGNRIIGNSANNSLEGRGGSDTIEGGGGNDYFKMHAGGLASFGFDVIDGGAGLDTVDHDMAQSALNADLAAGTVSGGDAGGGGGMTLVAIESFEGGAFNDRISGSAGNNQLFGNAGNDTLIGLAGGDSLVGGDGNDWIEGGSGFNTLIGGAGNDSFVFTSTSGRVTDFAAGADQLAFENAVFTGLGAQADWAAGDGRFRSAAGATSAADADDRLIYNTTNGNLYYDSDGAGGAASQLVTTLANLPALSASDITVI